MNKIVLFASGMVVFMAASSASAAVCTTNAGAGTWNTVATWSCGHVPLPADSVVISRNITVGNNITVTSLTINAGVTLTGAGNTLNITGDLTNNGIISRGARLNVTGAASIISGTGTYTNSRLYTSGAAPTVAAGAVLNFTGNSRIYVGRTVNGANALTSVLTINGTINSTVTTGTTNFIRLYANNTVIGSTGVISAAVSAVTFNNGTAKVTNNGSVTVNMITQNAATNAWTQGVNSNLTVNAVSTMGTLNASAMGNTVTFNAPARPILGTYFNLAGTAVTCPLAVGITVMGTSPCTLPPGVTGVTMNPTACVNDPSIGTVAWTFAANPLPANATRVVRNVTTNYVKCTGYGFAIPAGATITGIAVGVNRLSSGGTISDAAVRTLKAGAIGATDRSTLSNYTRAAALQLHGGAADLWGNTWLPADINAANFGAAFAAKNTNAVSNRNRTVTVSGMPITVYYTGGTSVDHFLILHPSVGLTCSQQNIQVAACANALCTTYTAGVAVALAPGGGSVLTTAAGPVNASITQTTPGLATLTATSLTPTVGPTQCRNITTGAATNCTMTINSAGFVITLSPPVPPNLPPNHFAGTQVPVTIAALQANPVNPALACIPAYQNVTRPVNLSITYANPNTGTMMATVSTAPAVAPNAGTVGTAATPYNLVFGNTGVASMTMSYPDVGQVSLNAADTAPTGIRMVGSASFIAVPKSFSFSNITPGPIKAGTNFAATITALNLAGVATPNFGKEVPPQLVTLTSNLVAPVGGANPVLAGTVSIPAAAMPPAPAVSFTNGAATVSNLSWGEVGNITLTGTLTNYLGSGLNTISTSATVGQFVPEHFDTAILQFGGVPMACPTTVLPAGFNCPANPSGVGGMVYSGQPFSVQVTAKNLLGGVAGTTLNYQGAFAKPVTLSAWNAAGAAGAANANPGGGVLGNNQVAAASFALGVGITALPTYTLPAYAPLVGGTPAVGPTNFFIRANDADATSLRATGSIEAGLTAAYGRIKITNAYGSELLPLTLPATAQFFNSSLWTTSITDNATSLTFNSPIAMVPGGSTNVTPLNGIMNAGQLSIKLSAPGVKGVATITPATAPAYLPIIPGTATFGVYKGSNEFIYQREAY